MWGPTGGICVAAIAYPGAPKIGCFLLLCSACVDGGCLADMSNE